MKFSKRELQRVITDYNLGKVKSIKLIKGGFMNYNFDLKTDKGDYILQVLGEKPNEWKKKQMALQFRALIYLEKKKFPYKIPVPIKNSKGKFLHQIGKKYLWIYEKIQGRIYKKINKQQFKELAKAVAIYHKYIKEFKCKFDKNEFFDYNYKESIYRKMRETKPTNKMQKIAHKNLPLFAKTLSYLKQLKFNVPLLFTHSDFHNGNVLYKGNKIIGIIDFDNVTPAPKSRDIIISLERTNFKGKKHITEEKKRIFIEEYKKHSLLSDKDIKLLEPLLLYENCGTFGWLATTKEEKFSESYYFFNTICKKMEDYLDKIEWNKKAYLTIDDAPSSDFKNKINYLSKNKIPAIFFCIGEDIEKNEEDLVYAIKKGFIIGNHSYNHPHFSDISLKEVEEQVKKTDKLINELYDKAKIKRPIKLFRFPYLDKGGKNKKEIQKLLRKYRYKQPRFNIDYNWYKKEGHNRNIDIYCTYDSMDWTVADKSYEFGIKNLKDLFNRMDENVPEGGRGLNFFSSDDIIMMHDDSRIAKFFKPLIERMLKKGIKFSKIIK